MVLDRADGEVAITIGFWTRHVRLTQIWAAALSAEEFLEDGRGPRGDDLVRVELRTDLQGCVGRFHTDDLGEHAKVVDVACPCRERLHREDVTWRCRGYPQARMIEYAAQTFSALTAARCRCAEVCRPARRVVLLTVGRL